MSAIASVITSAIYMYVFREHDLVGKLLDYIEASRNLPVIHLRLIKLVELILRVLYTILA